MNSRDYWKAREEAQRQKNIAQEAEYSKRIQGIYTKMYQNIQDDINSFYVKYADAEGITLAEAKKRISKLDIDEYAAKAKRYVEQAAKDRAANHGKTDRTAAYFSDQANAEMRLYNATMKINRLELLKAHLGLEMIDGHDELEKFFGDALSQRTMDEFKRQAGILGNTILNNEKLADSIVNASFHNAEFSDRVWMAQDLMKYRLHEILTQALIKGLNPRTLASEVMPLIKKEILENKRAAAERLLRTELCRVQTDAQMESFERNGFDKYIFLAEPTACPHCRKLDDKVFDVKDAMPGENAPPMHPNCVLPDTKIIAPDADAIMRAKYSGDVIEFRTANGTRLCVTPNHIVLTSRGWVAAKNLIKGDQIVHYSNDVINRSVIEPTYNDGTVSVEDLFTSIVEASSCTPSCVPSTAVTLKGDVLPNSKVDIVSINSELRDKIDIAKRQLISDSRLVITSKAFKRELSFEGTLASFLGGIGLVADGIMSGSDVTRIFLRGSLTHHELVRFRLPSDYNARLIKAACNGGTADIKFVSKSVNTDAGIVKVNNAFIVSSNSDTCKSNPGLFKDTFDRGFMNAIELSDFARTFSGIISFDNIVSINRKFFSGHVYDTSCMSTLYICNGIITSNCRCSTSAYFDDTRLELSGVELTKDKIAEQIGALDKLISTQGHRLINGSSVRFKTGEKSFSEYMEDKRMSNFRTRKDVTDEWKSKYSRRKGKTIDKKRILVNGLEYMVDNDKVLFKHSDREKHVANVMASYGYDVSLLPEVKKPEGIQIADYEIMGERYDLKSITGKGKNTLIDAIKKKEKQAHNFIFDLEKCPLSIDAIETQITSIFRSDHTLFVDKILLFYGDEIKKVYKRNT